MSRTKLVHFGLTLTALMLFAAGCASTQTALPAAIVAPPTAGPTAVVSAPTPTAAPSPTPVPATNASAASDVIRFAMVSEKSEARYRVREQLANVSLPSDAIGKTHDFTGTLAIKPDGTIVSEQSKFVVNLETLATDRSQRDNFVRRAVLHTSQYPDAVFVPTQATGLATPLPQSGAVSFKLAGNLTIHDVTKPITWDFTGQVQGGEVTGQATTSFTFEDFGLTPPKVPVVLSVEDHIQLELDVDLQRQ